MPEGNPLPYAVDAEANLEKLATSLAQVGVEPQVVKAVEQMADTVRQIVKALGEGQPETADDEPPAPEEPEPERPATVDQATRELQSDMQQSARR